MLLAMREAEKARQANEVPCGCVVVKDGRVIARGWNQVESLKDATAHAEMLALTAAEAAVGKTAEIMSILTSAKARMEMPHRIYPPAMKILRRPSLSAKAPIRTVVKVAATAETITIREMSVSDALNIL